MKFIGRNDEIKRLKEAVVDNKSKIITIIGRRGVGKTSLVEHFKDNYLKGNYVFFELYGEKGVSAKEQKENFIEKLKNEFPFKKEEYDKNWGNLFTHLLEKLRKNRDINKKYIFSIDEFPWLHTKKSNFVQAFGSFWNKCQLLDNVYFILTGSAVAWMDKNVINTGGGLYGKMFDIIELKSFTFLETVEYLYQKSKYSLNECLYYYIMTNGVARYLERIKYEYDIKQNMKNILKSDHNFDEFDILFTSSFDSKLDIHKKIIELFKNKEFITSAYIEKHLNISAVSAKSALSDLLASDLILAHNNYYRKSGGQEITYSLNDLFCFCYLKLSDLQSEQRENIMNGYAFEIFAKKNMYLINNMLGRRDVDFKTYIFENNKAQIDLLIKYKDNVYYLVECKNYASEYEITNDYAKKLDNKIEELAVQLRKENNKNQKWSIKLAMFTTYGTKRCRQIPIVDLSLEDAFNKHVKLIS